MRLTLLIPELLWSEPGDSDAWTAADASQLAKFLARRRPDRGPVRAWEHALLEAAGLPADSSLAELRAAGEPPAATPPPIGADAGHWLCADPVHLRFHQDRLILADAAELGLDAAELAALAETLNEHLAPNRVHFAGAQRGYLRLPTPAAGAQRPLSQKVGCEVRPSDLGDDADLRRLGNEIQMLLHAHPVNRAREAAGRPVLNALWLWGAGRAVTTHAAPAGPRRWIAHRRAPPLFEGVARRHGQSSADVVDCLPRAEADTVVFSDALLAAAHYQDSAAWAAGWQAVERELLAPAFTQLFAGALDELAIVAPTAFGQLRWSLTPWPLRLHRLHSLVRPPRPPLSSLAAHLAALPEDRPA